MVVLRGMISIQNIEKSFSGNPVLQDVSFDIPDGKICGVFGKSGIGKSTLAKVLCGVCPPDAGAVMLDGQTLVSTDHPYNRRLGIRIQMVYQQPYATLDPSQKIGAGFTELIRYHRFRPKDLSPETVQRYLPPAACLRSVPVYRDVPDEERFLLQFPLPPRSHHT